MSLSQQVDVAATSRRETDREPHAYGFVLVLVSAVLVLAIAATLFTPVNVGEGVNGILLIGP